jgi:hypothetical protein
MKRKNPQDHTPRPVEGLPTKPEAAVADAAAEPEAVAGPGYEGSVKADSAPEAGDGDAKAPFAPGAEAEASAGAGTAATPDLPDQQRPPGTPGTAVGDAGAGRPGEQYVRLRMRLVGDRLTVVDSHLVDGPLLPEKAFGGTNAYEVALGNRLLHAGSLPDLGVQRSFINPEGPESQQTHHIAERDVLEFSARVPAAELTPDTIGDVAVRLHRVKGEARAEVLSGDLLDAQFSREMRPMAELRGLPASVLPDAIEARGARTPSA